MKPKMYTKILRNFSEKHGVEFPAMTLSYSMEKVAYLDKASSEFFKLEVSPVEGQSLLQKDKKSKKKERQKKKA